MTSGSVPSRANADVAGVMLQPLPRRPWRLCAQVRTGSALPRGSHEQWRRRSSRRLASPGLR
eukprot:391801-Pyramimonas_sp.AAC.1